METLSHKFIEALAVPRDRFYALALAKSGDAAAAETLLQHAACAVFGELAKDSMLDIPAAMDKALDSPPSKRATEDPSAAENPMPAGVWARLAAAVQFEASRSNQPQALHPDSMLLQPDPMLAPKKGRPRAEPPEFDVSSPGRLFMLVGAAVFVGLAMTVYIVTRRAGRPAAPSSHPAATTPASSATIAATTPATIAATVPAATTREAP
jgi:hypothetical protein